MTEGSTRRLLLAAVLAASLIACGGDDDAPTATVAASATVPATATVNLSTPAPTAGPSPTPLSILDATTATIAVEQGCINPRAGAGAIWVAQGSSGTVVRIDPATNAIVATIDVGAAPYAGGGPTTPYMDIAIDGDNVWLTAWIGESEADAVPSLLRIDPATNTVVETHELPAHPFGVNYGGGSLWITSSRDAVVLRVDPANGETIATVPLADTLFTTVGVGAVWAGSDTGAPSVVARIDPRTNQIVATIPIHGTIKSVLADDTALWVSVAGAEGPSDFVARVDPATNTIVATIPLAMLGQLVLDGDDLWVVTSSNTAVARIDRAANQVTALYHTGSEDSWHIDVDGGVIWVANPFAGTVTRIDP